MKRTLKRIAVYAGCAALVALTSYAAWRLWPRTLEIRVPDSGLAWNVDAEGHQQITMPGRAPVGFLGRYDNELFAYLMFDLAQTRESPSGRGVILMLNPGDRPTYTIAIECPNNLIECADEIARLHSRGIGSVSWWAFLTPESIAHLRDETQVFIHAWNGPVQDVFHNLSPRQRASYVSRFLRFKAATDRRVLGDSALSPLNNEEALGLAGDIIAVADFYDLPLTYFLGIGAMENNYLNVNGDLQHRVWKRRAQPGDVVVRRSKRGVLVENPALGVWQITRETLRFAHSLYLKDRTRDYSKLPPRLQPARKLDIDHVPPETLTTYAGLLLRYLLDHFNGDVSLAVGAYNGGPGSPNPKYETGVSLVADYARRILDRAALIHATAIEEVAH
ncbi:MAG TPA: hypothetical protein VFT60_10570 [Bryobacteraceae bacterium]|nr:hypothetical protein [Bryobacteraceae bacterium]